MPVINADKISDLIVECSDTYILPRYNALSDSDISTKTGPNDLVTQADIDVEDHLKRVLPDILPGSIVIGEEGVSSGEMSLDALKDSSRPIWIVDPVDGTYNFVHGKREFGVMLGLIVNGVTQIGWIYDVLGQEMSVAERGAGAFCAGKRLEVANVNKPSEMSGHINPKYFPPNYREHIKVQRETFKHCRSIGCAAHEYLRIAKGQAQFSVYSRMKPWDHVPGALIIREAGGQVNTWDGDIYKPDDFDTGIIATASEDGWRDILDIFTP
ncbi:MAG: inositol monophosphatase [Alphaproteobacteria bacterium]|nr:inositol monophosphatase [Alphaproteobacteria bacterium]